MANILYRSGTQGTTTFTPPSTNGSVARALTNAEIDGNFYSLDQAKFEIAGGTITGPTTFSSTVAINGNLTVAGTTTTINATNLAISDRNIELATGSTTAAGANGGGITLKGDGDKTITWDSTNANWTSSEHWNIATGKSFKINNVVVLNNTTLGSSIVNSSLTKLGTSAGFVKSDASGNLSSDTNTYLTGNQSITLSGDITGTGATAITATIANSAVTTAKIADINVTTAKIADANVTTVKLADGAATIAKGGVGFTTYAAGDIIYSNAVNSLAKLNKGSDGQVLKLVSGFPAWAADNDTVYSLPLAADGTRGGVQIGYSQNGKNYPVQLSGEKMYVNVPWTDTDTDTNTTYSIKASVQTGGAGLDLDAGGSGSGTDTVKILGSGATTVTQTDVNTITISSTAPGNGTLTTAAVAAGPTNTTVSLNLSGAYSANTTDNRTINPVVGPAITNLAAFMTNTPAGFIKRTGQDAYSIDTNTYLTSYTETDTLATVTARGASTSSNITLSGNVPLTLDSLSNNIITTGNQDIPLYITTAATAFADGSDITLQPGQAATGGAELNLFGGNVSASNGTGGWVGIAGGRALSSGGGTAGGVGIVGGYSNGTSGTKTGGSVYIDGGGASGAGTNNQGNIFIGTRNETQYNTGIITIGRSGNTIRLPGVGTSGFVKLGANGALSADTNTYLTSYTETDTLASVTGRGATTNVNITFANDTNASFGSIIGPLNPPTTYTASRILFNGFGVTDATGEYYSILSQTSGNALSAIRMGHASRIGRIEFGNMTYWDGLTQTYGNGTYPIIMRASAANGASAILEVTSGEIRSPIFYEYNNTSYYLDLASTGTSLAVRGALTCGSAGALGGGQITINGGNGNLILIPSSNTVAAEITSAAANGIIFKANSSSVAQISSSGIISSSNITAYGSPSDRKLKENIKPLVNSLEKIMALEGVSFNWKKDTKEHTMVGLNKDIGLIAQNVQEVVPELVREGEDGTLSLRDRGLVAILIEAIKELNAKVEDLQKQLSNK